MSIRDSVNAPPREPTPATEQVGPQDTATEQMTGAHQTEPAPVTEPATVAEPPLTGPPVAEPPLREPVVEPERAGVFDASVMPRSRGAVTGLALVVLGAWGAIVPFIGPYFHYAFINMTAWSFPTYGRLWLSILPGVLAMVAGLMLIGAGRRGFGATAGALAAIAGAWFVFGQTVSQFWYHGVSQAGAPLGGTFMRTIEQLGYFYVLGAVILFLGAVAFGRMSAPAFVRVHRV